MLKDLCWNRSWLVFAVVCGLIVTVGGVSLRAAEKEPPKAEEKKNDAAKDPDLQSLLDRTTNQAKVDESRNRYLARHHTETGIRLFDALGFEEAKTEFETALQYDKNNKEARKYLRTTNSLLALKHGEWSEEIENVVNITRVGRQIAKVEMENRFEEAKAAFDRHDYKASIDGFERTAEIIKWIEPYADVSRVKANTADYLARSKQDELEQKKRKESVARAQATAIAIEREKQRLSFEKNRVEILLDDGRRLYGVGRFEEAQKKFNVVADMDPENDQAKRLAENARIAALEAWHARNAKSRQICSDTAWELVDEFSVPLISTHVYDVLWYDVEKWFKYVVDRKPVIIGHMPEQDEAWKQSIRARLQEPVSFDFVDTPLEDVVQFLRQITEINFVLDKKALEDLDNSIVTLKVTDMKTDAALNWILRMVGLKYVMKDNAVFISDKVQGEAIRQLYDVTDLTLEIRDFKGDLRHLQSRTGTGTSGGGGGDSVEEDIFGEDPRDLQDDEEGFTGKSLVEFIKKTIAPGTWAADDMLE